MPVTAKIYNESMIVRTDPVMAEMYAIKDANSARFGHNIDRISDHLITSTQSAPTKIPRLAATNSNSRSSLCLSGPGSACVSQAVSRVSPETQATGRDALLNHSGRVRSPDRIEP